MANRRFFLGKTFDPGSFFSSLRTTFSPLLDPLRNFLNELGPLFADYSHLSFELSPRGHGTLGRPSQIAAGRIHYPR